MSLPNVPEEVKESAIKQVASLALTGATAAKISKLLNLPVTFVKRTMQSPEFKDYVKKVGDDAVNTARNRMRAKAEDLEPEVWQAIRDLVKSESAKAKAEGVRAFFRLVGVEKEEEQGMGSLVINLPGQNVEKVIEVKAESEEDAE